MLRQFELLERIKSYNPAADEALINRAYVYAMKMHGTQIRESGDLYFSHPLEVAGILTHYRLDTASIVTALLHDTVEDTEATAEEIVELFGSEVAKLVDGVTKLTRLQIQNVESKQAENFRKLLLAMSEDIRVLIIKLADRLHNMRTLQYVSSPQKRKAIALETMEIYSPLAARLGMEEIKTEFEDLAFTELYPDARRSIIKRLSFLEGEGNSLITRTIDELNSIMLASKFVFSISGREKTPYSIWKKMKQKGISFEQLSDIMAFRIIVNDIASCYNVLGVIHSSYNSIPGRFKDYISTPKRNGYRSLHTQVVGPNKHRIEIQIRTQNMHDLADMGVAAHWQHKQGVIDISASNYNWLHELVDILDNAQSPQEFMEHTKLEMFQDQVFCFTPKGELINLPVGAGAIDFAYAVHTEIGNTCIGAKVNGVIVPLRTKLVNGDQVEISTSTAQTPPLEWERVVVTGKARAHIRKKRRIEEIREFAKLGRSILEQLFSSEDKIFKNKLIKLVSKKLGYDNEQTVYSKIGLGHLAARDILEAVYPDLKTLRLKNSFNSTDKNSGIEPEESELLEIKGLTPGLAVHMSECCLPLPGDRIVGILRPGKGADIHIIDCPELINLSEEPERWLDLVWGSSKTGKAFSSRISITVLNEQGSLGTLSMVIANHHANITNIAMVNRSSDFIEMKMDIEVNSAKHLDTIISALNSLTEVYKITRFREVVITHEETKD